MCQFTETLAASGCNAALSSLCLRNRELQELNPGRTESQLYNQNPDLSPQVQAFLLDITGASHVFVSLIISVTGAPGTLWQSSGIGMHTWHLKVATCSRQAGVEVSL